jgi:hypothetical protein
MVVTTIDQTSSTLDTRQVYLQVEMKGIISNKVSLEGWYTIYDLNDNYDLIIGKNWMTANPHTVDHTTNTLHMLSGDWTALNHGSPILKKDNEHC